MTTPSQSPVAAARPSCHHLRLMSLRRKQSPVKKGWRARHLDSIRKRQRAKSPTIPPCWLIYRCTAEPSHNWATLKAL